jgi:Tol biopolymer transport system component
MEDSMDSSRRLSLLLLAGVVLCAGTCLSQDRYLVRQLSFAPAQEGFPFWSPDGKMIVFSRSDTANLTGLWMVRPEGGDPWQFSREIGEHPTWSPDGHYIVFDGDSGNSIKIVSSGGGTPIRIVPDSVKIFRGGNPNWAPDGTRFVFRGGAGLRLMNLSRGTAPILFSSEGSVVVACGWSRDGGGIFFWRRPEGSQESALWMVSLKGEAREILPLSPGKAYRYMDQSPDGSLIAYTVCEGRACDIWVMRSSGGVAVRLTAHPALDESPRWSPDGTKIAFTSTRSRSFDVWVMDLDLEDLRSQLNSLNRRE